jgi:hypothetical protein
MLNQLWSSNRINKSDKLDVLDQLSYLQLEREGAESTIFSSVLAFFRDILGKRDVSCALEIEL